MRREQDLTDGEIALLNLTRDGGIETLDISTADVLELARESIANVFGKQVQAAHALRVDAGQLNKWLSGKEQFPLIRIVKHTALRREFFRLVNERCGESVKTANKWIRLWLITAKAVRVVASKFEQELERDVRGKKAA